MLIIPSHETIVITPPRTGSTILRDIVLDEIPRSFSPYRHMEAAGIPFGYENYKRLCVIRHPLDRLWSLYKYVQHTAAGSPEWRKAQRDSTVNPEIGGADRLSFSEWLLDNNTIFAGWTPKNGGVPSGPYRTKHPRPETRKSQALYAYAGIDEDEDKAVELHYFEDGTIWSALGLQPPTENHDSRNRSKGPYDRPTVSDEAIDATHARLEWDFRKYAQR